MGALTHLSKHVRLYMHAYTQAVPDLQFVDSINVSRPVDVDIYR